MIRNRQLVTPALAAALVLFATLPLVRRAAEKRQQQNDQGKQTPGHCAAVCGEAAACASAALAVVASS